MLASTFHSKAAQAVSSAERWPHLPGRGIVDLGVLAAERQQPLDLEHVPRARVRHGL